MTPNLEIYLLGRFQIIADGQELSEAFTPRVQSLLAYLILHAGVPQPRQRLAYILWPDTSETQSRTNLRKAIHYLRQALPCPDVFLSSTDARLQWNLSAPFSLDVTAFEDASAAGSLERAAALYDGDLLPDCYAEWIVIERERLRQVYLEGLARLIQHKEDAQDYSAALSLAERLLQYDPLREEIHRHVMRLHALNGDRAAALRAYQSCATILQRELGVVPSPATLQVYRQVLDHPGYTQKPLPLTGSLPLVGRAPELALLLETWHTAVQGKPHLALIRGEAGIGKTRLAEELLVWVDRQGLPTSSAHCYALEGVLAYAPVIAWLRDNPVSTMEPEWQTELGRLLPELIQGRPGLSQPGPLIEPWQRQRFYEALARAVLGVDLAKSMPRLLLIEDLQWCDCDTLEWLHYLLRFNFKAKLLVLGTLRNEALPKDCLLSNLLTDLRRLRLLTEIELKPLTMEETSILGRQAAGHSIDSETARRLYAETEGNPLFVVEYARSGLAEPRDAVLSGEPAILPAGVQAVVSARLAQVSPPAQQVMELAAVIGREFSYEVLAQACTENEETLVQALDELWQRGVIREQKKNSYDFAHDKLRQVALVKLSPTRRRQLHRRVAAALEAVYSGRSEPASGQIGWHYSQGGENAKAVEWLLKAGEAASRVGAFSDALRNLDHALDLTPENDLAGRFELLLRRVKIYHLQADRDAQAQDLSALERLAGELDDPFRQAHAAVQRGSFLNETSDLPGAIAAAQAALGFITQARLRGEQATACASILFSLEVEAYCIWGTTLEFQGNHLAALAIEEKALEIARRAGLRVQEARVLIGLAHCTEDISAGIAYLESALPVYREVGDRPGECACLDTLGYLLLWSGKYGEVLACYQQCLQLARQIGYRRGEADALFRLGHFYNQMGAYAQGKDYLQQSLTLAQEEKDTRRAAYNLFNLSVSERGLGQPQAAKKHALEALAICQAVGDINGEIVAWNLAGSASSELKECNEAVAAYQHSLDLVQNAADPSGVIYCQAKLAHALLEQGERQRALVYVEEILRCRENGISLQGTDEGPMPVYMDCYRVLNACADPRARMIVEAAHALLQEQAGQIKDEALRRSFLENKPENRELAEAWGEWSRIQ